jgi:hypothetical protein
MIMSTQSFTSQLRNPIFATAILFILATTGKAQSFSVSWFKIAGGGGTCANGPYSLSGTSSQHDAGGPMTNGQYSVTGGFWALPTAVQTLGAPTLIIVRATAGQVTISWSPNTPGYVLQETLSLSPTNWTFSSSGTNNPVTVPAQLASKFYRLFKP